MNSGKKCKTEHFLVFAQIFTTGNVEAQKKTNIFMVIADIENRKGFFTALGVTHAIELTSGFTHSSVSVANELLIAGTPTPTPTTVNSTLLMSQSLLFQQILLLLLI